jgi:hypothetical protein
MNLENAEKGKAASRLKPSEPAQAFATPEERERERIFWKCQMFNLIFIIFNLQVLFKHVIMNNDIEIVTFNSTIQSNMAISQKHTSKKDVKQAFAPQKPKFAQIAEISK